jgi:cysteinyl-tRNA synthetase
MGRAAAPDAPAIPDDVAALLRERDQARADRDFARADAIRSDLAALGWDVTDTASGPALSRR